MNPLRTAFLFCLLLLVGQIAAAAPPIAVETLLESERYWPYRVTLKESFTPEGGETAIRPETLGVLIRVESETLARVDFSTAGKHSVPIASTDLVENANRVRRGELPKELPNFVHAIRARLVDPSVDPPKGLSPEVAVSRPGFLCVFADPDAKEFEALVEALAPLRDRHDVMTLFFPQGKHKDGALATRLRELGWEVPFLYDYLSEPYTRTLLEEGTPMPTVLLQTDEGREVFQSAFSFGVVPRLTAALDGAFAGSTPIAGAGTLPEGRP